MQCSKSHEIFGAALKLRFYYCSRYCFYCRLVVYKKDGHSFVVLPSFHSLCDPKVWLIWISAACPKRYLHSFQYPSWTHQWKWLWITCLVFLSHSVGEKSSMVLIWSSISKRIYFEDLSLPEEKKNISICGTIEATNPNWLKYKSQNNGGRATAWMCWRERDETYAEKIIDILTTSEVKKIYSTSLLSIWGYSIIRRFIIDIICTFNMITIIRKRQRIFGWRM